MDFDFLNPPAIVQERKRYTNFTITPIGGPEDIIRWRKDQEAKDSIYQMRLKDRVTRVENFEKDLGQKLATPTVHTSSWHEKQMFARQERVALAAREAKVTEFPPWEYSPLPEPKLSIFQRILRFLFKGAYT